MRSTLSIFELTFVLANARSVGTGWLVLICCFKTLVFINFLGNIVEMI